MKIYSLIDSRKEKVYYAVYKIFQKKGNFENENGKNKLKLEMVKSYEVSKLDKIIEEIIENDKINNKVYMIGDAIFNYKEKILDKLGNYIKIFEDKNLKINTMTFVQMFLDENLKNANVIRKTDIFNLKPDYLEKSQAERDKK